MKDKKINTKKKMGKGTKIALAVLGAFAAVVLAVGVLLVSSVDSLDELKTIPSHIRAVYLLLTNSKQELEENLKNIKQDGMNEVKKVGLELTPEMEDALSKELITSAQFNDILLGNKSLDEAIAENDITSRSDENSEKQETSENVDKTENAAQEDKTALTNNEKTDNTVKETNKKEQTTTANTNTATNNNGSTDERIAELVTKMYVLKANYVSQIESIVDLMKSEFSKLPVEKQTTSSKQSIAGKYMSRINAMEAQCDAQVNAIVTELEQLLKKSGRDNSLAEAIKSTYAAEKDNTKAYYVATYGD